MRARLSFLLQARPTQNKIDRLRSYGLTDEQIEQTIAADPTEKEYVDWIAQMLSKKLIRLPEDTQKIKDQLARFQKLKRSPAFTGDKDIFRYTPAQLYEAVGREEMPWEQLSEKEKERQLPGLQHQIISGVIPAGANVKLLVDSHLNGDNYKVWEVDDVRCLMALSQGTNWCTKGEDLASQYLEEGPEYICYLNNLPYSQFDAASRQYMDSKDEDLTEGVGGYVLVENEIAANFLRFLRNTKAGNMVEASWALSTDELLDKLETEAKGPFRDPGDEFITKYRITRVLEKLETSTTRMVSFLLQLYQQAVPDIRATPNSDLRARIIETLGFKKDPRIVPFLVKKLDDLNTSRVEQLETVFALGNFRCPESLAALQRYQDTDYPTDIRPYLLQALRKVDPANKDNYWN